MGLHRRKKGGSWYATYRDGSGKLVRRSTGTTRKDAAQRVFDAWVTESALVRAGAVSAAPPKAGQSEIEAAVEAYIEYLSDNGDKHIQNTRARLERLCVECGWKKLGDLNAFALTDHVRKMLDLRKKDKPRLSKSTQARYIGSAKAFSSWLVKSERVLRDPFLAAEKPKITEADRTLRRRYLLPEEWKWLKHSGQAVLYETAIQTGFRLGELLEIRKQHLRGRQIVLPAQYTKNKKLASQFVTPKLMEKLPDALPFQVPFDGCEHRGAEQLRDELAKARAAYIEATEKPEEWLLMPRNSEGAVLDFHALRHTCGAWLALQGVYPKVIQEVMRHSSIQLTFDTYGHFFPGSADEANQHFVAFFG